MKPRFEYEMTPDHGEDHENKTVSHRQFPLPFDAVRDRGPLSLISMPSNASALRLMHNLDGWHNGAALIMGPAASGKTHMLEVFAQKYAVIPLSPETLYVSYRASILAYDNLELIEGSPAAQETLFHILNRGMLGEMSVLIASEKPLNQLNIDLPDLRSRLSAISAAVIGPPEEEFLNQLLMKHFVDAQVEVKASVIEFLSSRIERSYVAVDRTVKIINSLAIVERRAITIPLVKEALRI